MDEPLELEQPLDNKGIIIDEKEAIVSQNFLNQSASSSQRVGFLPQEETAHAQSTDSGTTGMQANTKDTMEEQLDQYNIRHTETVGIKSNYVLTDTFLILFLCRLRVLGNLSMGLMFKYRMKMLTRVFMKHMESQSYLINLLRLRITW